MLAARVDEHLKKMGASWNVKPGYKQTEVGIDPGGVGGSSRLASYCRSSGRAVRAAHGIKSDYMAMAFQLVSSDAYRDGRLSADIV